MSDINGHFPKAFAITLNWNGKDDTIECVASLLKLNYSNYEIVVVDNGSTDGSVSALRARHPDITIIENGRNLGYAEGFNVGLRYAHENGADYFLILNNDTVIDSEALTELVKVAQQDEKIGFVSGKVYFYSDQLKLQSVGRLSHPFFLIGKLVGWNEYDEGQYDQVKEYDFIDDVFLLVRKAVYEKVGGYDANFFLHWEETDWCARVRRAGFKIVYTPKAKIWHKGNLTTADGITPSALFYQTRNQIPFMWRNAKLSQLIIFFIFLLFKKSPLTIARFVKHGNFKYLGPYIRGILSGLFWVITKNVRKIS